jgi:hypothetical protein
MMGKASFIFNSLTRGTRSIKGFSKETRLSLRYGSKRTPKNKQEGREDYFCSTFTIGSRRVMLWKAPAIVYGVGESLRQILSGVNPDDRFLEFPHFLNNPLKFRGVNPYKITLQD